MKSKIALTISTLMVLAACGGSNTSQLSSGVSDYQLSPAEGQRSNPARRSATPTPTNTNIVVPSPTVAPTNTAIPTWSPGPVNPTDTATPTASPAPNAAQFSGGQITDPSLLDFVSKSQNGQAPRITVTKDTDRLDLGRATTQLTSAPGGNPGKDLGVNAVQQNIPGIDGRLGKALIYRLDDNNNNEIKSLVLRDPETAGWLYQSFGQVFDRTQPAGYVSVGKPSEPSDITNFHATYDGVAVGTYDTNNEVVSKVTAAVNGKNMNLNVTNSVIAQNIRTQGFDAANLRNDNRFNVSNQALSWDSENKRFTAPGYQALFYGPHQEEMGGTFNRTIDGKDYRGGFGAKVVR